MVDIYSADTSRDGALRELLLVERHHLGVPNSRCEECETIHLKTASALMSEAGRMNGGDEEDFELSEKIDNLDNLSQSELRKIRKKVQQKLGVEECNSACSVGAKDDFTEYLPLILILGGLALAWWFSRRS